MIRLTLPAPRDPRQVFITQLCMCGGHPRTMNLTQLYLGWAKARRARRTA